MKRHLQSFCLVLAFAIGGSAGGVLVAAPVQGAELSQYTKKMLADLKLDPSILADIDQELKVPPAWIAAAKKEGKVRFAGSYTATEWPLFIAAFKARYPFIEIEHQREGSRAGRVDKPLIAFMQGHVTTDIISAVGSGMKQFRDAGALTDLSDLPNFTRIHPDMRAKDGLWIGERLKAWCMSYNPKLIKKQDMPARWEDILTVKALHGRNIGIANRPHNWVLNLWLAHGEEWTRNFLDRLVSEARPQMRKEGTRAVVVLTIAGEFHAAIPSTARGVYDYAKKGAPIAWHCPEPVPVTISELIVVKGSKNLNSAKIFLNWFLSKEGQLHQYHATTGSPVHKDLQDLGLVMYANETKGKALAIRPPESLVTVFPKVQKVWNATWVRAGGPLVSKTITKVKTKLTAVEKGGRGLRFKVKGGEHKVKMSGSRSEVTIGGKRSARSKLKAGMECEISYLGNGNEARKVSCQ